MGDFEKSKPITISNHRDPPSPNNTPKYINIKKLPKVNSFSHTSVTPKEISQSLYQKKEELTIEEAIQEGYLLKQGQKWKTWKKRWFVLKKNGELYYKKDYLEEKIIKKINIKGKQFFCPKQQYIKLVISDDFELNLFSSEKDFKLWVNFFKKVGAESNFKTIELIPVSKQIMVNGEVLVEKDQYLLNEFLSIGKKIGQGSQATVHTISIETYPNLLLTIKLYDKYLFDEKNDLSECYNEINILSTLKNHENIIKFYGISETKELLGIVLEYCECTLYDIIEKRIRIPLKQKIDYLIQIIDGLEHLHQRNYIHRDIKLENILLSNHKIKICDFGLTIHSLKNHHSFVGTSFYLPPELFHQKIIKYNEKTDIYSFGMLMYLLLYDKTYPIDKELDYFKNIQENNDYRPNLEGVIPSLIKNLISITWNTDPNKRPSLKEIKNKLKLFI